MCRQRSCFILSLFALAFAAARCESADAPAYRLSPVQKGEIQARVSATGTVNPVTLVQVGSQVSGTIDTVLADYNDRVTAGQILARIDPAPFEAQVKQAEANLARAQADAAVARQNVERSERLIQGSLISRADYDLTGSKASVADATVRQMQAALTVASTSLAYTTIRSPVTGVVISRAVNRGQTVAASFQTPVLFTIAKDLTRMQVDTNVSEADIGQIRQGQKAVFTVDAFPDSPFEASVREVRFDPVVSQSVVTYDAVLEVANPDLKLRPGMTANVTFLVSDKKDVLKVPNAALRFVPPSEAGKADQGQDGTGAQAAPAGEAGTNRAARKLWVQAAGGALRPVEVKTGVSDDQSTEIVSGDVKEGDQVATGLLQPGADRGVHNPFLPKPRK